MDELTAIKNFLLRFPQWGENALLTETVGAAPGDPGLFPKGTEEYGRRQSVTGNVTVLCRSRYLLLFRRPCRQEENARWLQSLCDWIREESAMGRGPALGDGITRIRGEKGRLRSGDQAGTALYELELIAEYEKIYKGEL